MQTVKPSPTNKRILFLVGSMNQTTQMHQIAQQLSEYDCWFSQVFSNNGFTNALIRYTQFLDNTILSGQFKKNSDQYLLDNNLQIDYKAKLNRYDLVVFCTDMILPRNLLKTKSIWVQEGMTDPPSWKTGLIKKLGFPGWLTGDTSLNGASNRCDLYCVASEGYKTHFINWGTEPSKIIVTGIPNYDHFQKHLVNDFPHKGYVMVATTDLRETNRKDNRLEFIRSCIQIAGQRPLLFKIHPNEKAKRAIQEIRENTPKSTLIFQDGNTHDMIANSVELITQYSTVVYMGLALGKPVHSYFDIDSLKKLMPFQNQGKSAKNIAQVCRDFLNFTGKKNQFVPYYNFFVKSEIYVPGFPV